MKRRPETNNCDFYEGDTQVLQRYRCGSARTLREVCEAWGLVQQAYEKLGYAAPRSSGLRFSPRDFFPDTKLFVTYELRRLVCSFSVVGDDDIPLPSEAAFPEEVRRLKASGGKILEGTKFAALEDTYESQRSVLMTLAQLFVWAHIRGADRLIITVNPHHVGFWKRKFGFDTVASVESYSYVSAPGVLMCASVREHLIRSGGLAEISQRQSAANSLFSTCRIAQLLSSDPGAFEGSSIAEQAALMRHFPQLRSVQEFFSSHDTPNPDDTDSSETVRGSGIQEVMTDLFTALEYRLRLSQIEFGFSLRDFPLKFELQDPLRFLVALQTMINAFLEKTPRGARLWATARLASNGRDGGILLIVREDTSTLGRGGNRPPDENKGAPGECADRVVKACQTLSKLGAYFAVETERNVRYLVFLMPLAAQGERRRILPHNLLTVSRHGVLRLTDAQVIQ